MEMLAWTLLGIVAGHCLYLLCYAFGWFAVTGTPYANHIEDSLRRYTRRKGV